MRNVEEVGWWPHGRVVRVVGPLVLALFQVVGTFGASRGQPEAASIDALAVALVVAGPLSLIWIWRYPVTVLGLVALVSLVYVALDYPYGPFVLALVVAVAVNVVRGHRAAAWTAMAGVVAGHFALDDGALKWQPALGVVAWALLVLLAAEFVRVRRERAVASSRARVETGRRQVNEERLRIAHELHDVVAHHISLINVQAGVALHLVDRKPEQAELALATIKDASKEALTELRSLVEVLRDESAEAPRTPVPMLDTLDDLVVRAAVAGLGVRTDVTGARRPLPAAVELAAVRIVQEAITNVVRHAQAARADVTITFGDDTLTVRVTDDGREAPASLDEGSGIRGMRERAGSLGGTLTMGSVAGGVQVQAMLPTTGEAT